MRIYRDILQQAWRTLWRSPYLWVFGLFAALAGNGGEYASIANTVERIANQATVLGTLQSAAAINRLSQLLGALSDGITSNPLVSTWILLITAVLVMLIVWVIVVSQAALIRAAGGLAQGQRISFTDALGAGVKHFWPVFLLNVLLKFVVYLVLVSALLPFLIYYLVGGSSWTFDGVILLSYVAFVPLTIVLSFIAKYAAMYVVLEGERWWHALDRAIGLFFRNWLVSLEMAGLLLAINLTISILLVFVLLPDALAINASLIAAEFNAIIALRLVVTFITFLAVGAWFATFQYFAWTFLFHRLQTGSVVSKIVRLAGNLPRVSWLESTSLAAPETRGRKK